MNKKILIIGSNIAALAANYVLSDRGYDTTIVARWPHLVAKFNFFVHGPWRPVGNSEILMEILGDLDIDFDEHRPKLGARLGNEILNPKQAREAGYQKHETQDFELFSRELCGHATRELSFDREEFFYELASYASLEHGAAVHADSVSLTNHSCPVFVADPAMVEGVKRYPEIFGRLTGQTESVFGFDCVEFADVIKRVTWGIGGLVIEASGVTAPDIDNVRALLGPAVSYVPGSLVRSWELATKSFEFPAHVEVAKDTLSETLEFVSEWTP